MKHRKFGALDWEASVVGFGVNGLPVKGLEIDEGRSIEMIHRAIDGGINFIDAGDRRYLSRYEQTIRIIDRALQEVYCDKVRISVGLPVLSISSAKDFNRCLNEDIKRLNREKIDFYFLAGLDRTTWPRVQKMNLLNCLETAMADGRIDKAGFSFHDHFLFLRGIIEGYDKWSFCRFRYSYMDSDHHPGTAGIKYAAEKGLVVITDEPFLSGRLLKKLPESVFMTWSEARISPQRSLAEWGLLWILNQSEVTSVLIDMGTMEDIEENILIADKSGPEYLTIQELLLINRVYDCYSSLKAIPCTTCRACMPCPVCIDVPRIFELFNESIMYGDKNIPAAVYKLEGHSIDLCKRCDKCAQSCGRKISIPRRLKEVEEVLGLSNN